ncbi:MAG: RNA polymerase sigma factor [Bacteroidales bacterium]|nr:RNA polymerase sigma factor [Bacteroidales bacterium]
MDDHHYIERVLKGDLHAYTPLVEKYRQYVYALVKRTCPHPAEAEELAQDVFVKAYERLGTFRGASAFSTWLYRIAFNTAVSHARKKKRYGVSINDIDPRHFAVLEEDTQEERSNAMRKEQSYAALERLLASLPADEQMLVSLFYKQGLNMEEVAYIGGLTLTNTKVKMHRIRKKLYTLFQEEYSDETNE